MSWSQLSSFSLASFEMDAQMGGTGRFADAVTGVEDQISLSPQALGMLGVAVSEGGTLGEEQGSAVSEGEGLAGPQVNLGEAFGVDTGHA